MSENVAVYDTAAKYATKWLSINCDWPTRIGSMEFLGCGSVRAAYSIPGGATVLKVSGEIDNEQHDAEIMIWESAPPRLREHLAAIHFYGEGWIIAERATIVEKSEFDSSDEIYYWTRHMEDYWGITDLRFNRCNVGRKANGKLCAVDYSGGYNLPNMSNWAAMA
jgi:hypothetical protein